MSHIFTGQMFNTKTSRAIALGFVLALAVSTVRLIKANDNDQNVSIQWINDNGENCHQVTPGQSHALTWTAQVTNDGPGDAYIEKAAFHSPIAGCASVGTDEFLDQSIFSMSGKTDYAEGESGQVTFTYMANAKNCGRVQVDAAYRNSNGSYAGAVFLGEMINYGVDCGPTTPPPVTPPINNAPVGNLDAANCEIIGGWVYDPDSSSTSLVVEIFANGPEGIGTQIFSGPTTGLRSDVNTQYGITGNHGYTINMPANLKDGGTHEIWVYAKDTSNNQNTLFTNRLIFNSAACVPPAPTPVLPTGYVDLANCTAIAGWATDADTPNAPVAIHIYMDGPAGSGTQVATTLANLSRADVGNHAFHIETPAAFKDGNPHTVFIYAIDTQVTNTNKLISTPNQTIHCPIVITPGTFSITKQVRNVSQAQSAFVDSTTATFGEQVEFKMVVSAATGPVNNLMFSDALPSRLNYVSNSLTVDGAPVGNNYSNVSLGNFTAGQSKQIVIRATVVDTVHFPVGSTTLTNVATASSGATPSMADADVVITKAPVVVNNPPTGYLDQANCTAIAGWATDSDTANTPVVIRIYKDGPIGTGTLVTEVTANLSRTDVGDHAFHVATPATFKDGNSHSVYVYAVDTQNSNSVILLPNSPLNINCVITVTPGTVSITKQVRNISQNQSSFQSSVSANPGEQVEFRMVVTASNGTVNNVSFTDTLPSRLNYITGTLTLDGSSIGNNLSGLSLGTMNAGQTRTVTIRATVAETSQFATGTTTLTNNARVDSSQGSSTADASVTVNIAPIVVTPGQASLFLTKQVRNVTTNNSFSSSTQASNGDTVQFRLVVQSTGSAAANDVRVTDFLPSNLSYLGGTFQVDGSASGNLFSGGQYFGQMTQGQTRTMTFNAQVVNATSGQTITNTAQASASNASTVNAQANVTIGQVLGGNVNLVLSKKAYNVTRNVDATTVVAQSNDIIRYTITVQNTGNATATGYVFVDNVADVLQLAQLQDFPGASFDLLHNLKWAAQDIPANSTVEKTFTVKVNATHPAGTDNIMTNTFGNTVNVQVNKGTVAGAFVAPTTGAGTNMAIALSLATLVAFVAYRNREKFMVRFN